MKQLIIVGFFSTILQPLLFPQNVDQINSGHFTKSIAFNFEMGGDVNLASKDVIESLLLGDFNAPIEFFYNPYFNGSPCTPVGFRMIKDSLDKSYILEIKSITNFETMRHILFNTYESIGIPGNLISSIPEYIREGILIHHKRVNPEYFADYPQYFKVKTQSFPISDQFAEKLYKNMVSFIDHFKETGVPPPFIPDGYSVKFRTVVAEFVWTLRIYIPQGNALKMSDLCRKIISNAFDNQLDESKYMTILNTFEH